MNGKRIAGWLSWVVGIILLPIGSILWSKDIGIGSTVVFVGDFALAISTDFFRYDRETFFESIMYVFAIIVSLPILILAWVWHLFAHTETKERKRSETETKILGEGHVEKNDYGNNVLVIGNEYSGYDRIDLVECDIYLKKGKDNKGNKYSW